MSNFETDLLRTYQDAQAIYQSNPNRETYRQYEEASTHYHAFVSGSLGQNIRVSADNVIFNTATAIGLALMILVAFLTSCTGFRFDRRAFTTWDGKYEVFESKYTTTVVDTSSTISWHGKWNTLPDSIRQSIVQTKLHNLEKLSIK